MILNNPKLWMNLLEKAPKGSVLMGGAVVDFAWSFYHIPKDYDIFYPTDAKGSPIHPEGWEYIEAVGDNLRGIITDYSALPGIVSVHNFLVDKLKVQLIGVYYDDPREHFESFDHSLTLGSFSENGLFISSEVYKTIDTRVVKCVTDTNKEKALARAIDKTKRYSTEIHWEYEGFD